MSKYSDYIKSRREKEVKFIFGDDVKIMGDTYSWNHAKNDDEVIIVTSNVRFWKNKGTYVLWVANDKVVYLKDWQVCEIKNWDLQKNAYAVKLNRKFFKSYNTYTSDEFGFDKEETFDDMLNLAREQDKANIAWKIGHYNF